MRIRNTVLALLLAASALAQTPIPETSAGKVLAAWLEAFNSGDRGQIRAFDKIHRRETPPPDQTLEFRERTGGFTLLRIEKSEPLELVALLQEKNSDTIARLELLVTSEASPKIVNFPLRAIPRPADFAIPRLTEKDALQAVLDRAEGLAGDGQFSGAMLIARRGKILLQKAWGAANRETSTPATLDTQFRIGSMNKMFTATAALQLVEAGKLSLDDPIGKHLPDYANKDAAAKVTVRHLLTHSGGTGDIFGPEFSRNRLALREHSDYLKLFGPRALMHEPGAEHSYSNFGYVLLGAIIEKVTGGSYYDYVRSKIYEPAGMKSSGSLPETEEVPNRSAGYMKRSGAWVSNADTLPWRGTAAGGGYSTVGDLFRFSQALESGKLLSKQMLAEATSVQGRGYGYGFTAQGEGVGRSYGHGGGAPGMNGELRVYPELGYVLVSLSNLDPPAATRLVEFFALRMPATP